MSSKLEITIGENDIKSIDIDIVNILLKQLNPAALPVSFPKIKKVMKTGIIITLRNDGVLIGMGTLIPMNKLFSFCGSIEDVIVEKSYRSQGLGKKILQLLIKKSKTIGMKFVDLTSSPERKKANKLYSLSGFERRKTNVYRLYN